MISSLILFAVIISSNGLAFGPQYAQRHYSSSSWWEISVVKIEASPSSDRKNDKGVYWNSQRGHFGLSRSQRPTALSASSHPIQETAEPVKIIIAGAPASGKGTQCEVIKNRYGVVHLSTGDILRESVAAGTEVGKKAKEYMDSGKLVPDEVIIDVVKERLSKEDCQTRGWLLDGFPRTQAQANALQEIGVCADCFLFLNVPDEILVERVVGRRTDPETGKIYHLAFSPPQDEAVMARLVQRSDDTKEKVKVRLEQFHANVGAVRDSYTSISVTINGNQAPSLVSEAILDAIDSRISKRISA